QGYKRGADDARASRRPISLEDSSRLYRAKSTSNRVDPYSPCNRGVAVRGFYLRQNLLDSDVVGVNLAVLVQSHVDVRSILKNDVRRNMRRTDHGPVKRSNCPLCRNRQS